MKQEYQCRLIGDAPLIMHNGTMADPLNPIAKRLRQIASKRDKTEADLEEMARLEWHGSLYLHDNTPCLPGEVLEATLINAAKKRKKGSQAKAGMLCLNNFPLEFPGPKDLTTLWADPQFRLTTGVVVNRVRIMRTRPIFRSWQVGVTVTFNDELLNPDDIAAFLRIGGESIGIGDWRPRFGRYALAA